MDDNFKAVLKKDLFCSIIANGSAMQKENAIDASEKAYQWCVSHIGQAPVAPNNVSPAVRTSRKS